MKRFGECSNCGHCCQFDGVRRNIIEPPPGATELAATDRLFYELRGGIAHGRVIHLVVYDFSPCSAHDQDAAQCRIYETRPETCREFPQAPEQIEGTPCSYWFEDAEGNRRGGSGSPHPTEPVFG